jgi:hypothetical protein
VLGGQGRSPSHDRGCDSAAISRINFAEQALRLPSLLRGLTILLDHTVGTSGAPGRAPLSSLATRSALHPPWFESGATAHRRYASGRRGLTLLGERRSISRGPGSRASRCGECLPRVSRVRQQPLRRECERW